MNEKNDQDQNIQSMYEEPSFDISMDDLLIPEVGDQTSNAVIIDDEIEGGFKFNFLGVGQGGSRLAETFYKMGYRRCAAINTAEQDLNTIDMPNKLLIAEGGAGKNPDKAREKFREREDDVLDFIRRSFGDVYDKTFICAGAGGGTGSGLAVPLVQTVKEVYKTLKVKEGKVGMILTLPKDSEGSGVMRVAGNVLEEVWGEVTDGRVSPLIIVDNERVGELYPNLSISKFWETANKSMASLFHLFNLTCAKDSTYSTFDSNDYKQVLDSGILVYGASPVKDWEDPIAVSRAIRENLKGNLLTGGVDIGTATCAGAIVIGGSDQLDNIRQSALDDAFSQLSRMLRPNSLVHRGIYSGDKESLTIFTAIGGVQLPGARKDRLKNGG
jgi:cell division GTPase FtsZ